MLTLFFVLCWGNTHLWAQEPGLTYFMFHQGSGKVLDGNGSKLYFQDFNQGDYQKWRFDPVEGGLFKIVHLKSGKVLAHKDGKLSFENWENTDFQKWDVNNVEYNRYIIIINKQSGLVLDGNGKDVYMHKYNGGDYQKWSREVDFDKANWMKNLNDNVNINQLSIPGTHDSGTQGVGTEVKLVNFSECKWYDVVCLARKTSESFNYAIDAVGNVIAGQIWARCQSLTIAEQLNFGIRFLDMRCRKYNNGFTIHHGAFYCNLNFDQVLDETIGFLKQHPTETVLMSVKEEHDAVGNTKFEDILAGYIQAKGSNYFFTKDEHPRLGDVRGKIVILKRAGTAGIDFPIDDDAIKCNGKVCAQDIYKVMSYGRIDKEKAMVEMINKSANNINDGILYVNFVSGFALESPYAFSVINNLIFSNYIPKGKRRLGIVPMDFPPGYLVHKIIISNF